MALKAVDYIFEYTSQLAKIANIAFEDSKRKGETFFSSLDFEKFKWNKGKQKINGET